MGLAVYHSADSPINSQNPFCKLQKMLMKTTFGIQTVIPLAILIFLNSCSKNNVMNKRDSKDTVPFVSTFFYPN
jgi:hypothetical protein